MTEECLTYSCGMTFPQISLDDKVDRPDYFEHVKFSAMSVNHKFNRMEIELSPNEIFQQNFFVEKITIVVDKLESYKIFDVEHTMIMGKLHDLVLRSSFSSPYHKTPLYITNNIIYAPNPYALRVQ
jgi:hypothetical protein